MPPEKSQSKQSGQPTFKAGNIDFGDLRRLEPITRSFGYERGQPIDRFYIEKFLGKHAGDFAGYVVEVGDDRYTRQFGGAKVTLSNVLDQNHPDSSPTLTADLTNAGHVPSDTFNCCIITQTLQYIYNIHAAIHTLHRILKPGGVLLASLPSLSPISRYDMDRWGDYWRFTSASVHRFMSEVFGTGNVEVEAYGNVLVSTAFLYGMASQNLTDEELDFHDRDYESLVCVRAVKS